MGKGTSRTFNPRGLRGFLKRKIELLKEVWKDEGVVTGRSLDMFVSKLRKKLPHDTAVNLGSVHGKGYRLDVQPNKLPEGARHVGGNCYF
ncbi:MAG TPA: winged helix-turn-helix domain-containing protein [Cyclobacteriaceae bacterium]|nr:winged helix-turn-helix domain-containing protein [Cyclobacteriaceae bacterium]